MTSVRAGIAFLAWAAISALPLTAARGAPTGLTEPIAGPRLSEPPELVLLTEKPAREEEAEGEEDRGEARRQARRLAELLGQQPLDVRPDPREYRIDLTLAPIYNFDLDSVDSIPETLSYLLISPWLIQRDLENPLERAVTETELLNTDEGRLERRLLNLGLYVGANLGAADNASNAILFMLKRERIGVRDPWISVGARMLTDRFSGFIGTAQTTGDEIAIDIGVHTMASYSSVANVENMILSAQHSGLRAIAVTDLDTVGGALFAQKVAERLKREGRLRKDFTVIVGQQITTREGHIYALFIHEHVLQGMTAKQTIRAIHRQGGLAILEDPANRNGIHMARKYRFDGYVIRPGLRRLYRSLQLASDPKLWGEPAFYTLSPSFKDTFGIVYTVVDTPDHTEEGLKRAIGQGSAYAAGNGYFPHMAILGMIPVTKFERILNRYFDGRAEVEGALERLLGADNIWLRVSWTDEVERLMNLEVLNNIERIADGDSALTELPEVDGIALSYGPIFLDVNLRGEDSISFTFASRF